MTSRMDQADPDIVDAEVVEDSPTPGEVVIRPGRTAALAGGLTEERLRSMYGDDGYAALQAAEGEAAASRTKLIPTNTAQAYARGRRKWEEYAERLHPAVRAMPSPAVLENYVGWLLSEGMDGKPYSAESASSLLTGAAECVKAGGFNPDTRAARLRLTRQYKADVEANTANEGRGKSRAPYIEELLHVVHAQPDNETGIRNRAMLLIGWCALSRPFELAGMLLKDIRPEGEMLRVRTRMNKTGGSAREAVLIPGTYEPEALAVEAWTEYARLLTRKGLDDPNAVAFKACRGRWATVGKGHLSPEGVSSIVGKLYVAEGFEDTTQHGERAGAATEYHAQGMPVVDLAARGGWALSSTHMQGYIRDGDALRRLREAKRRAAQEAADTQRKTDAA